MKQFAFLLMVFFALSREALADRVALFDAKGTNSISTTQPGSVTPSTCLISITNVGSVSQTYTLTITATATGSNSGSATAYASNPALTTSLAVSATNNYLYTYPAFPAASTGDQTVICTGKIVATGTAGNDTGVLTASGMLTTFRQSSGGLGSNGVKVLKGFVIHSQVPIPVGGGKSF